MGTFTNQPGLALGFDTEHDWSEGGGMDLFEGFFFGNTASESEREREKRGEGEGGKEGNRGGEGEEAKLFAVDAIRL